MAKTHRWDGIEPSERLLAKVDLDVDTGCWIWRGALNSGGYAGGFWLNGSHDLVHRAAWRIFVGPIPEGMTLDHRCRNRACSNPGHLEVVTMRENLLRGDGWSGRNARKTHCPLGHEYTPENTSLYRGQRKCRKCHAARERTRKAKLRGHLDLEDARADLALLEV